MAASTNPFQMQGTLSYPPESGAQQVPLPFGLSGSFTSLMDERLVMTGAGTQAVSFGSITNAKLLLVEYELTQGAAAIQLHINGSTDDIELTPGGVLLLGSPAPVAGVSSLGIERTSDAVVRVRILG
jgi:hypothetical protein